MCLIVQSCPTLCDPMGTTEVFVMTKSLVNPSLHPSLHSFSFTSIYLNTHSISCMQITISKSVSRTIKLRQLAPPNKR